MAFIECGISGGGGGGEGIELNEVQNGNLVIGKEYLVVLANTSPNGVNVSNSIDASTCEILSSPITKYTQWGWNWDAYRAATASIASAVYHIRATQSTITVSTRIITIMELNSSDSKYPYKTTFNYGSNTWGRNMSISYTDIGGYEYFNIASIFYGNDLAMIVNFKDANGTTLSSVTICANNQLNVAIPYSTPIPQGTDSIVVNCSATAGYQSQFLDNIFNMYLS